METYLIKLKTASGTRMISVLAANDNDALAVANDAVMKWVDKLVSDDLVDISRSDGSRLPILRVENKLTIDRD